MKSPTLCSYVQPEIDAAVAGGAALGSDASAHLQECALCRQRHADAKLRRLLQCVDVPAPRPGFADGAIRSATEQGEAARIMTRPGTRWLGAIAASVAFIAVVSGALVVSRPEALPPPAVAIAMTLQQSKIVRVLIESADDRDSATITISLAENLEMEGFPGDRVIEWDTPLKEGKNLLELPLRLTGGTGSHLDVSFSHGQTRKKLRIDVSAADPLPLV